MRRQLTAFFIALAVLSFISVNASAVLFTTITIDGDTSDWAGVPVAASDPIDALPDSNHDFDQLWIANDENNLYVRFTLHAPSGADPFGFSNNYYFDTDANTGTGFPTFSVGSELLLVGSLKVDQRSGAFNDGSTVTATFASAGSGMDFEFSISRDATYDSDSSLVFADDDIAILLQSITSSFASGDTIGASYTFASVPEPSPVLMLLLIGGCIGGYKRMTQGGAKKDASATGC